MAGATWKTNRPHVVEKKPGVIGRRSPVLGLSTGRRSPVPAVKNAAWVRTPIDAFILAKLEERGLAPTTPAEARALIRRATYDLTGLPPTPEEVEEFAAFA